MSRGWAWIISIVSGWKISQSFPSYCCSLSRRACVFAVLAAWSECGMERGYRTCVCVCVCGMCEQWREPQKGKRWEMECVWALACWECQLSMSLSPPLHPSFYLSLTNPSLLSVHGNYTIKTLQPKRIIATWVLRRDWEGEWVKLCVRERVFSRLWICVRMRARVGALYCIPEVLHRIVRVISVKDQRICFRCWEDKDNPLKTHAHTRSFNNVHYRQFPEAQGQRRKLKTELQ